MSWFKPNTTVEEKIEIYRGYGLNDMEIQAILTPFSQHSPEMRKQAFIANGKIGQAVEKENEAYTAPKVSKYQIDEAAQ